MVQRWTPSGVRLRLQCHRPGLVNWLFLPGGPGLGSESLEGLTRLMNNVHGNVWLVDLPGDGSNVSPPGMNDNLFVKWPGVLTEAALAVPNPVFVGHSTGGMYLLSVPELETKLAGLVLVSSAPDASWMKKFSEVAAADPLPEVTAARNRYVTSPTKETLRDVAVASAPWNFTAEGMRAGADLLARLPYNCAAMSWSASHFDQTYDLRWWPTSVPTMIVSGSCDRVVDQSGWSDPRYRGPHVVHETIDGGAHFPWIERPNAVREAFIRFDQTVRFTV